MYEAKQNKEKVSRRIVNFNKNRTYSSIQYSNNPMISVIQCGRHKRKTTPYTGETFTGSNTLSRSVSFNNIVYKISYNFCEEHPIYNGSVVEVINYSTINMLENGNSYHFYVKINGYESERSTTLKTFHTYGYNNQNGPLITHLEQKE